MEYNLARVVEQKLKNIRFDERVLARSFVITFFQHKNALEIGRNVLNAARDVARHVFGVGVGLFTRFLLGFHLGAVIEIAR